jgi:hypothetical protein
MSANVLGLCHEDFNRQRYGYYQRARRIYEELFCGCKPCRHFEKKKMITTIENKAIQRIISELAIQGITFEFDSDRTNVTDYYGNITGTRPLENVVFRKGDKSAKICFETFFRISGLSTIIDRKKDDTYTTMRVTDDMFYNMIRDSMIIRFKNTI